MLLLLLLYLHHLILLPLMVVVIIIAIIILLHHHHHLLLLILVVVVAGGSNPAQPHDVLKPKTLPVSASVAAREPCHPLPVFSVGEGCYRIRFNLVAVDSFGVVDCSLVIPRFVI